MSIPPPPHAGEEPCCVEFQDCETHTTNSSSELDDSGPHRGEFKLSGEELLTHKWPWLLCKSSLYDWNDVPALQTSAIWEFVSELM